MMHTSLLLRPTTYSGIGNIKGCIFISRSYHDVSNHIFISMSVSHAVRVAKVVLLDAVICTAQRFWILTFFPPNTTIFLHSTCAHHCEDRSINTQNTFLVQLEKCHIKAAWRYPNKKTTYLHPAWSVCELVNRTVTVVCQSNLPRSFLDYFDRIHVIYEPAIPFSPSPSLHWPFNLRGASYNISRAT